ncbi:MAG: hypothetical protein AAGF28_06405 [Pseudomonadota bacterium]
MKTLIASLSIVVFSTFAWAAGPDFTTADANADGVVTLEEAKVALPDVEEAKIVAADANNDGALSVDEYAALTAS